MKEKNNSDQTFFYDGAIPADKIAEYIQYYAANTAIGSYSIFLGQIRADGKGDQKVTYITYTAYEEMAVERLEVIKADVCKQYPIQAIEVLHSIGKVKTGELCLFVLVASAHRKAGIAACELLVERIKKELPIWGKEYFETTGYQWKVNL